MTIKKLLGATMIAGAPGPCVGNPARGSTAHAGKRRTEPKALPNTTVNGRSPQMSTYVQVTPLK